MHQSYIGGRREYLSGYYADAHLRYAGHTVDAALKIRKNHSIAW